jgi:hypothetical protein
MTDKQRLVKAIKLLKKVDARIDTLLDSDEHYVSSEAGQFLEAIQNAIYTGLRTIE